VKVRITKVRRDASTGTIKVEYLNAQDGIVFTEEVSFGSASIDSVNAVIATKIDELKDFDTDWDRIMEKTYNETELAAGIIKPKAAKV
jgi:hypothetical protein